VKTYQKSESKVASNYRVVCKTKYEKQFPGRIARKGLTVKTLRCDGRLRSVVLLRRTPKDEWDMEAADVQGVEQSEDIYCVVVVFCLF
jgi:hypothetical protein